MTHRYLESIASRCLVLGRAPAQLVDLLGFDPVVPADLSAPWPQVREVLSDLARYQHQVDAAYDRVRDVGSWDVRMREVLQAVDRVFYAEGHDRAVG
jgi:hypothetical protein